MAQQQMQQYEDEKKKRRQSKASGGKGPRKVKTQQLNREDMSDISQISPQPASPNVHQKNTNIGGGNVNEDPDEKLIQEELSRDKKDEIHEGGEEENSQNVLE